MWKKDKLKNDQEIIGKLEIIMEKEKDIKEKLQKIIDQQNDMNITHHYDEDADILYIDLNSTGPALTEELDDKILIDIDIITKKITGIRILDYKK
jgi:uncharacterized protein YuzE